MLFASEMSLKIRLLYGQEKEVTQMDHICQVCPLVGPGLPEEENQRPRGFQVTRCLTSRSGDGGAIWTQLAASKELVVCL